jgi:dynein heavy chain 1
MRAGQDIIDTWVDSVAPGGIANVNPSKIPWAALQALIVQVVYGGRIDNPFDKLLLQTFVDHLFSEQSYNHDFKLNASADLASHTQHLKDEFAL